MLHLPSIPAGATISMVAPRRFDPLPGHKIQAGPNILTVNDFECLNLDTHAWPSERVHCELQHDGKYLWVVEHFDDFNCTVPNARLPVITHGTECYYFPTNHSYRDTCNENRTLTISAWLGPGCRIPMPLTATNLAPSPPTPASLAPPIAAAVPLPTFIGALGAGITFVILTSLLTGVYIWGRARRMVTKQVHLRQRVEAAIASNS